MTRLGKTGLRTKLRYRDGDQCCWCHEPMLFVTPKHCEPCPPDMATVEHIIPLSEGGGWATDNLALAHHKCNSARRGCQRPPLPPVEARA